MHENRALPNGIVARLEALGQQLIAFAREHRDASLGELERGVLDLVRQALPELLGEVIEQSASGLGSSLARLPQPLRLPHGRNPGRAPMVPGPARSLTRRWFSKQPGRARQACGCRNSKAKSC